MPADLTGIENVNEFFSQHYLDELLLNDLGELRSRWKEAPGKSPADELRALRRDFLRADTEAVPFARERAASRRDRQLYDIAHPLQVRIAEALGYGYESGAYVHLPENQVVPILARVERRGEPYLLVVEGRFRAESESTLDVPLPSPLPRKAQDENLRLPQQNATLGGVVSQLFALEAPPRWVVVISGGDVFLAERARWGRGQHLRFDLTELFGRADATALTITAALLCHEALAPDEGAPLHDTLDEQSHKHAHGVSQDLKYAAREAVELIGNEYVYYQRTVGKKAIHGEKAARELTQECLIYLYRLLFLFYAEARAEELQSLPMNAEEYAAGYSLESLRELEMVPLTTPEAQNGYFIHESLHRLFTLVNDGHEPWQRSLEEEASSAADAGYLDRGFNVQALHSPLFDPRRTPRLSSSRLRNVVLQQVVQLLSLSREGRRGRGRRSHGRGRISYAQLGINQLGAVYEGLLSYTGFFAKTRLFEVHRADQRQVDETEQAFFVPESDLHRYSEEELTFDDADGNATRREYPPGTFIFRLAGRDRETSASYYTPEVLTRCLVKYSLKELLQNLGADDILGLRVCEPAMGSGAFLVEAIDQLADAYLERKQVELGEAIAPDHYQLEKQKVKTHLAVHNCYGVDLNPMAAQLASVSLWLATMHAGQEVPWLEARLAVGNSLIGARLEVWDASDLETDKGLAAQLSKVLKKHGEAPDLERQVEELLNAVKKSAPDATGELQKVLDEHRRNVAAEPEESDEDETSDDATRADLVKALKRAARDFKLPRHHRKPPTPVPAVDVVAGKRPAAGIYHFLLPDPGMSPFDKDKAVSELVPDSVKMLKTWRKKLTDPFTTQDAERLLRISRRVDELYRAAAEQRARVLQGTRAATPVWGQPTPEPPRWREIDDKQRALRALAFEDSPYTRLKSAMDLWSAFWAWPLAHVDKLPTRDAWWSEVERILGVEGDAPKSLEEQLDLLPEGPVPTREKDEEDAAKSQTLLDIANSVAARIRPHHWELEFSEAFVEGRGFDLIVGNPPWIRLDWNEAGVLGDLEPRVVLDAARATQFAEARAEILQQHGWKYYLEGFEQIVGTQAALGAVQSYPLLQGVRLNLYKCFITRGWGLGSGRGVVALIHQNGVFDDPRGGALRAALAVRLRYAYRFQNWLSLFAEVMITRQYCLSVTQASPRQRASFQTIANLFHPATVDACWNHDGAGMVPGIKTDDNKFETRGHRSRLVDTTEDELALFAALFDKPGTPPLEARLPIIHSREVLGVLRKIVEHPRRLRDLGDRAFGTMMWNETLAQKDGTIRRESRFPKNATELILSGPHFYVGNPLYKTPRQGCRNPRDYEPLNLQELSDDFLPRTNYVPACSTDEYDRRTPRFKGRPVTDYFRHVHRKMLANTGERTLAASIIPRRVGHVGGVVSVAFEHVRDLVDLARLSTSLPVDFLVRSQARDNLQPGVARFLPVGLPSAYANAGAARVLRLVALTEPYSALWNECSNGLSTEWSMTDARLSGWECLSRPWTWSSGLRNAFERRQALVEIDALAALELGLTIDELCTIYRTQFPILYKNERGTWYDTRGQVAFTVDPSLAGVGVDRKDFETWQHSLVSADSLPEAFDTRGFEPPFDRCDREEDMRRAYDFFKQRLS